MNYLIFNWKMNPVSLNKALKLFNNYLDELKTKKFKKWKIIIIPPFVYLADFAKILEENDLKDKIFLGGQNCFWQESGAYTGEISPKMLKDLGVKYVLLGHSERRIYFKENAKIVSQKANLLRKENLKPIICWGEKSKKEKPAEYLESILKNIPKFSEIFIAYEPIWAIGSGKPISKKEAEEKNKLAQKIVGKLKNKFTKSFYLYGGSINSRNIKNYLDSNFIDGYLIGGASLKAKEIKNIFEIVKNDEKIKRL